MELYEQYLNELFELKGIPKRLIDKVMGISPYICFEDVITEKSCVPVSTNIRNKMRENLGNIKEQWMHTIFRDLEQAGLIKKITRSDYYVSPYIVQREHCRLIRYNISTDQTFGPNNNHYDIAVDLTIQYRWIKLEGAILENSKTIKAGYKPIILNKPK